MTIATDDTEQQRLLERYGRAFRAGEVFFQAGEPAREAFLLQEGRVRLVKRAGAAERLIGIVRPGDLFGESGLLPGSMRTSTAIALVDGTALTLDQATFEHVFGTSPAAGLRVLQQLIRRLRDAEDQIELLMLRDSQIKVVVALLQLAQESARAQGEAHGGLIISVTPLELSARVGLDVETVKRNVLQLRNNGYVQIVDERVEIPDLDALRELKSLLDVKDEIVGGRTLASSPTNERP